jgi:hypothetical protein
MPKYEVWIEYGLQSIHNITLAKINRAHTFEDFVAAARLTKKFNIPICAHVILGLPGETHIEMMSTARTLNDLKIDAVKIHLLHVLKGSPMEKLYNKGEVSLLTQPEYVKLACDFLENLSADIIVQRVTGEGSGDSHIAPIWALDKIGTIEKICGMLRERGTRQGTAVNTAK